MLKLRTDLTEAERTALEDAVTTPGHRAVYDCRTGRQPPAGQNSMGMTGLAERRHPLPLRTRIRRPSPPRQRIWTPFAPSLPP